MPYVIRKQPRKKKENKKNKPYVSRSDRWVQPKKLKHIVEDKPQHDNNRWNDNCSQEYCYPSCNYNTNQFPFYYSGPPNVLIPPGFGPSLPWAPYAPPLNYERPPPVCYESPLAASFAQTRPLPVPIPMPYGPSPFPSQFGPNFFGGPAPPVQLSLPAQPGWLPINYLNTPYENKMLRSGIVATNPPLRCSQSQRSCQQAASQIRF